MPQDQTPDMQVDSTGSYRGPIIGRVANYFASQPFGNLLSFLVICGFGYWFWWSQTIGDGIKVKQIQDGMTANSQVHVDAMRAMVDLNSAAVKSAAEQHAAAIKAVTTQQAESAKAMLDHAEKASLRREKADEHKEELIRELFGGKPREKSGAAAGEGAQKGNEFGSTDISGGN